MQTKEQAQQLYLALNDEKNKETIGNDQELQLAFKVAQQASEEEFVDMMASGELPPVQLTNDELESLKGGVFSGPLGRFLQKLAPGGVL